LVSQLAHCQRWVATVDENGVITAREVYSPDGDISNLRVFVSGKEQRVVDYTGIHPDQSYPILGVGYNKHPLSAGRLARRGIKPPLLTLWGQTLGDLAFGSRTQANGASPAQRILVPSENTTLPVAVNFLTEDQLLATHKCESVPQLGEEAGNYYVGPNNDVQLINGQKTTAYEYLGRHLVYFINKKPVRFAKSGRSGNVNWKIDENMYSFPIKDNYTPIDAENRPGDAVERANLEVMRDLNDIVLEELRRPLYSVGEDDSGRPRIEVTDHFKDYKGPERERAHGSLREYGQEMPLGIEPIADAYNLAKFRTTSELLR